MSVKVRTNAKGQLVVDIRVRLPDGSRYRERSRNPVTSKSGCKAWGERRERHLAEHGLELPARPAPVFRDFARRWLADCRANKLTASTLDTYEHARLGKHILPALGLLRLDEVSKERVQGLKAAMADLDPKTVNDCLSVVSSILKLAVEWGELPAMPCKIDLLKRDTKKLQRFFTREEFEQLVAPVHGAELAFLLLGGEAGLRRGELVALEWPDIDLRARQIKVSRSDWEGVVGLTKGGKSRVVPLSPRLLEALQGMVRRLHTPRVLVQADGAPVTLSTLRCWMRRALRSAGLVESTDGRRDSSDIHKLRHTFGSHMAMAGVSMWQLQEWMGHASITTTEIYAHLSPGNAAEAMAKVAEWRAAESRRTHEAL